MFLLAVKFAYTDFYKEHFCVSRFHISIIMFLSRFISEVFEDVCN